VKSESDIREMLRIARAMGRPMARAVDALLWVLDEYRPPALTRSYASRPPELDPPTEDPRDERKALP